MPASAAVIRPLEHHDIDAIIAIQAQSPEIAPWTAWDYERVARKEMAGWVAVVGQNIAGFLVARRLVSDIEILNFAVAAPNRRSGLGSALLSESLKWAGSFGAQKALLEVRISNLAAIRFYERHGFEVVGRRPRYYTAPIEDALLLTASITSPASIN
jgi:[ribosomal protein S18]-alanine N-acetyltransferase